MQAYRPRFSPANVWAKEPTVRPAARDKYWDEKERPRTGERAAFPFPEKMAKEPRDDHALIWRAQRGDRPAMDGLIRRYSSRAYQYAYRLTRSPEEAGDVVAEAFVRAFNGLRTFNSRSSFSTWLYRIVTNCFLDARKRERSRRTVSLDAMLQTEEGVVGRQIRDEGRTPLQEAERSERETLMQAAVAKLPEYQRAIIVMYHVEMLTYEEMASALDLPIGTVKSRLNRARLNLRLLLANDRELFVTA